MKKIVFLLLCMCSSIGVFAEEKYHINVLREISLQQAQDYERKWEISTYTYTDAYGRSKTRYFLFAANIKHNSEIVLERAKQPGCPWQVRINGSFFYADFSSYNDLKVGDSGVLKYEDGRLYLYIE